MVWVIYNDDGIDAPGIQALENAVSNLADCSVVAPQQHLSGCSHQATTHAPIEVEVRDNRHFAVKGTPADCVRLALTELCKDAEWVLAGINDGGNLGVDLLMSGTVAAAREATLLGKKAIAFSQYRRTQQVNWALAEEWAARVVDDLMEQPLGAMTFWNVNFPDPSMVDEKEPQIEFCPVDFLPLPTGYRKEPPGYRYVSDYHKRPRAKGTDVDICFRGKIAVSEVQIASGFA